MNLAAVPPDEEFVERHALVSAFLPLVALPIMAGAVTIVAAVAGDGRRGDCRCGEFGRRRDGGGRSDRDDRECSGGSDGDEPIPQRDSTESVHCARTIRRGGSLVGK